MSQALSEDLDQRVLVCLRDGRLFLGYLRSYDQYSNLVLEDAVERVVVRNEAFADVPCGLRVIRGENVVLFGRVADESGELRMRHRLRQVSEEEIRRMQEAAAADQAAVRRRDKLEWPVFDDGAF
ncbi:hypothetical protein CDCA_CDCA02G0626 [Cyanidium caldarium]|uniref:U6 snRNA-associated Sm-like protein LSm1 n=1 Tax=Cyanidium caldarium TaxID=2771 RepID=A0AAV9IR94_CYACA|nr:hypothetical protein CDCA_CDCA02G0626 [Cyanidium caldarium]